MNYSIRPTESELSKAKNVVQGSLEASKTLLEKNGELDISLGWTEDAVILNEFQGIMVEAKSENNIEIRFNSKNDDWDKTLNQKIVEEYAKTWFWEKQNNSLKDYNFKWQVILLEAFGIGFRTKLFSGSKIEFKEVSIDEVKDKWSEIKDVMEEEFVYRENFLHRDDIRDMKLRRIIAFELSREIAKEHSLKDYTKIKMSDLFEIGDRVFGSN